MSGLKKYLVYFSIVSQSAMACDFSTGIDKLPDGRFSYTKKCHLYVGSLVADNRAQREQLTLLNKSIELKDLAIVKQEERVQLWMNSTYKLEEKVQATTAFSNTQTILGFGVGVGLTILSVWAAGQLK
jgi:hypothetical protein